ncbi:hypothetical protein [Schlesneria sp. T3-172]|uniref:hypothetical protein n=1 Tax=Schlesneria sphaerica TaxID=3373610 RepID=UPI0037C89EE3
MNRQSKLLQGFGAGLVLAGLLGIGWTLLPQPAAIPSVPLDQLGLEVNHAEKSELLAADLPPFVVVGADGQDNTTKNVRLWDAMLAVRGSHAPNIPQQIGDCVSWGAANAVNYLQAYQLVRGPPGFQFRDAYPPYIYGVSRVIVGRAHGSNFRGDGSVGAYAAEGVQKHGVLRADAKDVPPYSGSIARMWGDKGPPQWARDEAKQFLVKSIAQVKSAAEARDAICNGYPVTIASSWWGTTSIGTVDGRRVANRNTSWAHQQCLIGYDGSGSNKYFYCLNSWGPNAHPQPLQGEPPGGYWIRFSDIDRICREGDSWAFSSFDGFPAESLRWEDLLRRRDVRSPVTSIGVEPPQPPEREVPQMTGFLLLASSLLVISGSVLFISGGVGRRSTAALIALAAVLLSNVADAQPIDFAVATVRRAPTSPTVGAIGREPDWSSALQRRTVTQSDDLPDSWDSLTVRRTVQQAACKPVITSKKTPDRPEQCLFFTAPRCGVCDTQQAYLAPKVKAAGLTMSESPEADIRMIDVERHRGLQAEYKVESLPCLVYLDKAGNEVDRVTGFDRERLRTPQLVKLK